MSQQSPPSPRRVFYLEFQRGQSFSPNVQLRSLLKKLRVGTLLKGRELVAVKCHFGEKGTSSFLSPDMIQPIISFLARCGSRPFLTDTTTLYSGERMNGVSHAMLAGKHGFHALHMGAPVVIADGIKGNNQATVPNPGHPEKGCYIGGEIAAADYLVNCSHFTGHRLSGFGAAIKNLAMGCASRRGKMQQHSSTAPRLERKNCRACACCTYVCPGKALSLSPEGEGINLEQERCLGCAECIFTCRHGALQLNWDLAGDQFLQNMAEYAGAVESLFPFPLLHINFLLNITRHCDCEGRSSMPICPDLGIAASYDPVALDQASLDLVDNASEATDLQGAEITEGKEQMKTMGESLLRRCEELGLGRRDYRLIST